MQALWYVRPGTLEWREQSAPVIATPEAAIVRPIAVATCDLDALIVGGRTPAAGPFPVGHEFVAEVVEVGPQVRRVQPGDRVSVPYQISCGHCARCVAGQTGRCRSVPPGSGYGLGAMSDGLTWGGAVADAVLVPYADAMCLSVPTTVDPGALAGLSDNLVDGWRTVAPHLPGAAEPRVLVFGVNSVGLYAAGVAAALGAQVTYVDPDPGRCTIAERLGARVLCEQPASRYPGHPVVVHTMGTGDGLRSALRSTASGGVCTDTGIFFGNSVEFPLLEMYAKGATFTTGRADTRAAMPAVLDLITTGRLDPSAFVTRTAPWDQAPAAWADHHGRLVLTH
ncbi:threonine dehydrogenase-like Zn-dependent dehydrogenase [Kitasatospora sp. MAP12-15]|uniref:alcohol dehydrogenase catalytic domain-containing protein n=1 Tax=unclassified Kitasatospora TaxID=2633591 RepID=UPI002475961B|nr:alcohol dehydrogenase catalytic domain-containing protein [Kitasatospora sp. MAP12-44]MDH6109247.1 threonine dehydrogenase-like Zn-dependent dehydrogenase [Kitasatospora sp. MAP12-44]